MFRSPYLLILLKTYLKIKITYIITYLIVSIINDLYYNITYNNIKDVDKMINTNITKFRKNILCLLEQTIKFNEPINISTKTGNVVVISEEYYNGLMETLYLSSIPNMKETIIEGLNTPIEECISENEIYW